MQVRRAGAKKVYLASASPPVRYPNVYGVDMPTRREFVAFDLTEEEIRRVLGADGLLYQSLEDLLGVGRELNPSIRQFEDSCFSGVLQPTCHPCPGHFLAICLQHSPGEGCLLLGRVSALRNSGRRRPQNFHAFFLICFLQLKPSHLTTYTRLISLFTSLIGKHSPGLNAMIA